MDLMHPPAPPPLTDLAALHRAHYRDLVRLASLLNDAVGTCEEVVQDAFVSVWRRAPRLRETDRLPAYLRSAVLNGARSHLRRRQVRQRPGHLRVLHLEDGATSVSAEDAAVHDDDTRAVLGALRRLPDRQRDVLALRFWGDLSETEIAATLGIAPGTVKTHVHRALAALATLLEDRR